MGIVVAVAGALLSISALLAVYRLVRGPSILDRMVALEVLMVIVMLALLTEMAYHEHTYTLSVPLVLTALGFVGTVSVARYVSGQGGVNR